MAALGVFDSGIGGLTVVKEIKKKFPDQKIIYFGDTARVPYGPRGKEVVIQFALEDTKFLALKQVSAIVIACNTVSALATEEIKKMVNIPVWEMIHPAVAGARAATRNGRIGVIGTRGSIGSHAYKNLLSEHLVWEMACPLFVPFVEEGEWDGELVTNLAKRYLGFVKENDIDVLILGCTHYPVLIDVIREVVGEKVKLIHCGEEVAKKLHLIDVGEDEYYFSDVTERNTEIAERVMGKRITIQKAEL